MNWIRLQYGGHEISITDEAFAEIVTIVAAHKVCSKCQNTYTDDNPDVVLNTCLRCFRESYEGRNLTFVGKGELTHYGQEYKFIDDGGYIHVSSDTSKSANPDGQETLRYHGFALPTETNENGEVVNLHHYYVKIYGDLTKSAVVIEYIRNYGSDKNLLFMSQKGGEVLPFDRRKGEGRYLLERAHNIAQTTKDVNGTYRLNGHETYHVSDWFVYTIVAELASMEYDISQLLKEAA